MAYSLTALISPALRENAENGEYRLMRNHAVLACREELIAHSDDWLHSGCRWRCSRLNDERSKKYARYVSANNIAAAM